MKPGKDHPAWLHRAMGGRCDRPARAEGGRSPKNPGEINDRASEQYLDTVSDKSSKAARSSNLASNLHSVAGVANNLSGNHVQAALQHALAGMRRTEADKAKAKSKQYGDEAGKFENAQLADNGDDSFAKGGKAKKRSKR